MLTKHLEGDKFTVADAVQSTETLRRALDGFASMLRSPINRTPQDLVKDLQRTISEMVEVGAIMVGTEQHTLINHFYRRYFGEDVRSYVKQKITYRLGNHR